MVAARRTPITSDNVSKRALACSTDEVRGREAVSHGAHNPENGGSNPSPASASFSSSVGPWIPTGPKPPTPSRTSSSGRQHFSA